MTLLSSGVPAIFTSQLCQSFNMFIFFLLIWRAHFTVVRKLYKCSGLPTHSHWPVLLIWNSETIIEKNILIMTKLKNKQTLLIVDLA